MLKTGKTLQLHEPSVLTSADVDFDAELAGPGMALMHAPSGALVVRCAEGTFLRVPKVRPLPSFPSFPSFLLPPSFVRSFLLW